MFRLFLERMAFHPLKNVISYAFSRGLGQIVELGFHAALCFQKATAQKLWIFRKDPPMSALGVTSSPSRQYSSSPLTQVSQPVHASSRRQWMAIVIAVSVLSNAALLIAQQVSFRLLAPVIGSSVETWSAIIGVFLLGIAVGNHLAGKLADHLSAVRMISGSLLAGAVSLMLMPLIADHLASSRWFAELPLAIQIFTASFFVCLLPGILLSLVTPPSIRSVVSHSSEVGSAAGRIFAWGTLGSLAGNYLAGFVLLAIFGVRSIVDMTSVCLLVLAVATFLGGRRFARNRSHTPSEITVTSSTETLTSASTDAGAQWFRQALLTVFACSFVTGALEGAAFRILAPLVGVSMFLSAGVVGVILAGMSFGNSLGGKLATRYGSRTVLRDSLLACAVTALAVAPIWKVAISTGIFKSMPLIPQILLWSFSLFLLPAIAFGTITPQVIRLSVTDIRRAGTISGQLYAWSTVGCIAGILSASWFMIETFGAVRTSLVCGIIPIFLVLLLPPSKAKATKSDPRIIPFALLVSAAALLMVCKSPYDRESRYFSLGVTDDLIDNRDVKVLVLDRLVHSAIDLDDPSFLHYPHERIQGDFARAAAVDARAAGRQPRILVIGGGGYSFPRWIESQADLNDIQIDVVEIDPAVTEIAHDKLGLSRSTRINSIHMDGRQFVKSAPAGSYDLVIQDAVNDFSVPYHLMTAEYNTLIQRLLQPEGAYLLTVIDSMESARFLTSAVRTVEKSFGEMKLLAPHETRSLRDRSVFVIGGRLPHTDSAAGHENTTKSPDTWWNNRSTAYIFPGSDVRTLIDNRINSSPLLTDDFAPVDTLMTSHFLNQQAEPSEKK